MTRTLLNLAALSVLTMGSGAAFAQAGAGGPAPGTVNAGSAAIEDKRQLDARDKIVDDLSRDGKKKQKRPARNAAIPATAADLIVGSTVSDMKGSVIGKIETIEADGAIVFSGTERAKVPLEAFGKNKNGLLMPITQAEFNAAAAAAKTAPQG